MARLDPLPVPSASSGAQVPAGMRIYAIGDIHGRLDLFQSLIAAIRRDGERRAPARTMLILLGDLIDRGPDSAALVDRCQALASRSSAFIVLKGNHEAMMVDALAGNLNALKVWLGTGGAAALASWGVEPALLDAGSMGEILAEAQSRVPAKTRTWLQRLPTSKRIGDYLFVHAGIRPGVPLAGQAVEDLLWIRRDFLASDEDHGCVVVHGHSIAEHAEVRPNRIGIDTGAYRTGVLTSLMLEGCERILLSTVAGQA